MENDSNNEFVKFVEANGERIAAKDALHQRLPEYIDQVSDEVSGPGLCIYKSSKLGRFYVDTGDSYYDTEAPWHDWVAFARKIIAADEAQAMGQHEA